MYLKTTLYRYIVGKLSLFSSDGRAFDCRSIVLLSNCRWFDSGNREYRYLPTIFIKLF